MNYAHLLFSAVLLFQGAACSFDDGAAPLPAPADDAEILDDANATTTDGGSTDLDAGQTDASNDAGTTQDGGTAQDGGTTQDGGTDQDGGTTEDGGTADTGGTDAGTDMGTTFCGDGTCDPDETELTCPEDCVVSTIECVDGIDNDNDGKIDFRPGPNQGDPECDGPTDDDESK